MKTFEYANAQLETVERFQEQWKQDHDEAMASLDVEQSVQVLLSVRGFLSRIDQIAYDRIMAGECAPSQQMFEVMNQVDASFKRLGPDLARGAQRFVELGYTIKGYEQLRGVAEDPIGHLRLIQLARSAPNDESEFSPPIFDRLDRIGAPFRSLGNDD